MPEIRERSAADAIAFYPATFKIFTKNEIENAWQRKPSHIDHAIDSGKCITIEDREPKDALVIAALFMREINDHVGTTWFDTETKSLYLLFYSVSTKWQGSPDDLLPRLVAELVEKILRKYVIYNIVDDFQGYPLFRDIKDAGRSGAT